MTSVVEIVNEQRSIVEIVQEGDTKVVEVISTGVSVVEVVGKTGPPGSGEQITLELTDDGSVNSLTDRVFCTGDLTATLIDPNLAVKAVTLRCISGTTTIASLAGTVEVTTLTVGQSTTLAPRSGGWFEV